MSSIDIWLSILTWLLALPAILMLIIFTFEILFGLGRTKSSLSLGADKTDADTIILVPAHDEESLIEHNINALKQELPDQCQILLIADNCSDRTAELAANAGIQVIERRDSNLRGKAYALAFGRDYIAQNPPDCVIILDADCYMDRSSIDLLRKAAMTFRAPVQATNLVHAPNDASPMVQISNFALLVKNLVRQRGMTRLGGAALLTGTGMAFPWKLIADAPLASAELAEDLALGVSLTQSGHVPKFVEAAKVSSDAAAERDTLVQRTRWEHGFLTTARHFALPLIGEGFRKISLSRLLLGLHLLVPPLALLFTISAALLLILALLIWFGANPLPLLILLSALVGAVIVTLLAWLMAGRKHLSLTALLGIPFYILWKIPVYLRLFRAPEKRWIRTRRSGESAADD